MGFSLDLRYQICLQPIDLPVFNPVVLELLQLLAHLECDIDDVIGLINKDQALSIQILRMANSSAYAGRSKSETIKDSANRLGAQQITSLAMAASQATIHASEIPMVNDVMQDLWQHSYACAVGCRSLAINTGRRELADYAYLSGLLHDIGKLYLLKAMEKICLSQETSFELDRETLLDVFSDMHVEQGCRIMEHWDIPKVYHDIVARHHSDIIDLDDSLLEIVRLVNFKSMQYNFNLYPQYIQPQDVALEISTLDVSEHALEILESDMNHAYA